VTAELVEGFSTLGGGSAPGSTLPTVLIATTHRWMSATDLEVQLRRSRPPVVARIHEGRVMLDLRTVQPDQDAQLLETLRTMTSAKKGAF
jgi:L-seryl-tRNA(Ser) seleniumtransferase